MKSEATILVGKIVGLLGLAGFLIILFVPNLDIGASLGVSAENEKYLSFGRLANFWFLGPLFAVFCLISFGILRIHEKTTSVGKKPSAKRLILKRLGSVVIDSMLAVSILGPILSYLVVSIELKDFSIGPKEFVRSTPSLVDIFSLISVIGTFVLIGFVFFLRGERGARTPGVVVMGIYKEFPTGARDVVDAKRGFLFLLTYVLSVVIIPYYLIKERTVFMYDGSGVYRETGEPGTQE